MCFCLQPTSQRYEPHVHDRLKSHRVRSSAKTISLSLGQSFRPIRLQMAIAKPGTTCQGTGVLPSAGGHSVWVWWSSARGSWKSWVLGNTLTSNGRLLPSPWRPGRLDDVRDSTTTRMWSRGCALWGAGGSARPATQSTLQGYVMSCASKAGRGWQIDDGWPGCMGRTSTKLKCWPCWLTGCCSVVLRNW